MVAVSFLFNAHQIKSMAFVTGNELARASGLILSGYFETRMAEIDGYANTPIFRTMDWRKIGPFLKAEQIRHKGVYEKMLFALANKEANYFITTDGNPYFGGMLSFDNTSPNAKLKSIARRDYWQYTVSDNTKAQPRVYVSKPMVSYFTGVRQIMVAASILSEDKTRVIGMVSGSIAWPELERVIHGIRATVLEQFGHESRLFVVSQNGDYVFHDNEQKAIHLLTDDHGRFLTNDIGEKVAAVNNITKEKIPEMAEAGRALLENKAGYTVFSDPESRKTMYLFYVPVAAAGYGLGIFLPERVILEPLYQFYYVLGAISVIALALISWFSWWSAKKVVKPLDVISGKASAIAAGDWSVRIDYDYSEKDELGVVARSFNRMIDELQQRTERTRESHERMLTILDALDATVYVADMETYELLFINKALRDRFGDVTGKICWKILQKNQAGPCEFCCNDRLLTSDGEPRLPYTYVHENTSNNKWYHIVDRAIEWADGRIVRLEIATDITARKKAEEEERQAQKMEAIGTLAGGIAHDFNNILMGLQGFAELSLGELPLEHPVRRHLQNITSGCQRAAILVRQILTFSRKMELEKRELYLQEVLGEAVGFLRSTFPTSIDFKLDIEPDCRKITGDVTQMHQVVMNLCANARQAMVDDKGTLSICLMEVEIDGRQAAAMESIAPGWYVRLEVSDTGLGMDEQTRKRIFEPYFTTKSLGEGTGMGLATVIGIVKSHHGGVTVESCIGEGTTFAVYLPVSVSDGSPVREDKPVEDLIKTGRTGHALVVDDELAIADLIEEVLKSLGWEVSSFTSSLEAVEAFERAPETFDLIITDQTMPGLTGIDLTHRIQALREDIPIIVTTGFSPVVDKKQAQDLGIAALLMKPFNMKKLVRVINDVMPGARPKN